MEEREESVFLAATGVEEKEEEESTRDDAAQQQQQEGEQRQVVVVPFGDMMEPRRLQGRKQRREGEEETTTTPETLAAAAERAAFFINQMQVELDATVGNFALETAMELRNAASNLLEQLMTGMERARVRNRPTDALKLVINSKALVWIALERIGGGFQAPVELSEKAKQKLDQIMHYYAQAEALAAEQLPDYVQQNLERNTRENWEPLKEKMQEGPRQLMDIINANRERRRYEAEDQQMTRRLFEKSEEKTDA